jgi:hypothetical protein
MTLRIMKPQLGGTLDDSSAWSRCEVLVIRSKPLGLCNFDVTPRPQKIRLEAPRFLDLR